jgi:hypothetical protein
MRQTVNLSVNLTPQYFINPAGNRFNRLHAIDNLNHAAITIIGQDRRRQFVIDREALFQHIGVIISTRPAGFAGAVFNPVNQGGFIDLQLNDSVNPLIQFSQHDIKRFGLGDRAGETVKDHPSSAFG